MRSVLVAALLLAIPLALAGCSSKTPGASSDPGGGLKPIGVDSTTGGMRGVVVDAAIHPLKGVAVSLPAAHLNQSTGADGSFGFGHLAPGTYLVKASRPGYEEVQTSVDVVAGVAEPKPVRVQLTRLASEDPYMLTTQFHGYIACSAGVPNVGYSEECGQGVGVPCQVPPPVGCQRVGGQGNNLVQNDFHADSGGIRTVIIEQVWKPTTGTAASGSLYVLAATDLQCDPTCGWKDKLGEAQGQSPLLLRVDSKSLKSVQDNPSTPMSTFTWAGADSPNLEVDQSFEQYVSYFYWAEAPKGWSFVQGSSNPF